MTAFPAHLLESPLLVDFRDEIDRRLDAERIRRTAFRAVAEDVRAEFINGEVIQQVPNTFADQACVSRLAELISIHVKVQELGVVAREQALTEFPRNDYCPDLCFWRREKNIGTDSSQFIFPPPDFVVEVLSPSTSHRDRGIKFEDYEAHGVNECWIVDADGRQIEQFVAADGMLRLVEPDASGNITSPTIAGLTFPREAAFDNSVQLSSMARLLASP